MFNIKHVAFNIRSDTNKCKVKKKKTKRKTQKMENVNQVEKKKHKNIYHTKIHLECAIFCEKLHALHKEIYGKS